LADSNAVPVIAGFAIGIGFVVLVSMAFPSLSLEPEISKEIATEIGVKDMTTNYITNPPLIKIYVLIKGQIAAANIPVDDFLRDGGNNYTIPMAHTSAVDRTFYHVNPETRSLLECDIPYCHFREDGMEALTGRYAWIVDIVTQCEEYPHYGADIKYAIDTKTGQILWRNFASPEQQEQQEPFVCT
jgi:hypothetical protein